MVKVKMSDLYDIGSSKRVFQSEWRESGVPFYRAREIARLSADGYVDNELFIDEDLYEEYIEKYGKPQPGDVMITGVGTLGVCYVVKPDDKFYFKDGNILWFRQKAKDRILPEYLVKAFDSNDVKDFIKKNSSGTTVGTFTIQTANKMEIELPSIEEQKNIIEKIGKIEQIIKTRRQELEQLDLLIKSRFVEMFGDPMDELKANTTFTEVVEFNPKKSEVSDMKDTEVSFVPMDHVGVDGSFKEQRKGLISEFYKGYTYFRDGDVLIAKITPCFENGKSAIAHDCCNGIGFGTTEFHVARPIEGKTTAEWVKYLLKNDNLHEYASSKMTGSAGQKRIQTPFFEKLKVYLPTIEAQRAFSDFVNQVDKSKIAVKKSLDEVQLLFDSLMQKYFG